MEISIGPFPGGGLESGETHQRAAAREVFEETRLHIDVDNLRFVCEYEVLHDFARSFTKIFATSTSEQNIASDGIEIQDAGWYSLEALPRPRNPRMDVVLRIYKSLRTATAISSAD